MSDHKSCFNCKQFLWYDINCEKIRFLKFEKSIVSIDIDWSSPQDFDVRSFMFNSETHAFAVL